MFMVGFAWQQGGLPLSGEALREAIRLNGVAVETNLAAFEWGRRAAHDLAAVEEAAGIAEAPEPAPQGLDALVARRAGFLGEYQDTAYAERYRSAVARIAEAEGRAAPGETALAEAVARALFKLMAIKDEYEVARLYTDGSFEKQLAETFESWERVELHLAPPLIARRDPETGHLRKAAFGPWMMRGFRVLARLRRLRGTALDIFGYMPERRWERRLLAEYERLLEEVAERLSADNHEVAVALAAYPMRIRGFGHVKRAQAGPALAERDRLLAALREPAARPTLAEAAE
jgi:indolepyruvate ferredoxin oxidoreductase